MMTPPPDTKKVPMPPVAPSQTMVAGVDMVQRVLAKFLQKLNFYSQNNVYGKTGVFVKFWGGKPIDVEWEDKVTDKIYLDKQDKERTK